ncbi:hypothetical protein HF521_004928 [Silurus meridionalis]|uniref:Uncharacterized protein n=1 Tax=Silurus meridionalis TaxID=175797 RepID=A0A8T0B179_SILME|nr:hypothetical protein HF521_004928 [Silurus meridionalis]
MGLDKDGSDSEDESEKDNQSTSPVKKPHLSTEAKSVPAWKNPDDEDVSPPAIRLPLSPLKEERKDSEAVRTDGLASRWLPSLI